MNNLSDALSSKDKIKLNRLNDIITHDELDEQSLLIISSDTKNLNLKIEEYLTSKLDNLIKIDTIQNGLFKKILQNTKEYENKYILINLFSVDDYVPIREEFQFKRDYIPEKRLKFIFLLNFTQYESFKTKAYDFFSFNNFFHHFVDNSFTFVNDIDLSELDDMIKEYEEIKDTNISKQSRMKYLFDIGKKAHSFSQFNESLKYLDKALELAKRLKDTFMIANILSVEGDIYNNFGNLEKALVYQKEALKISKKIKYEKGISSSLGNIGHIYRDFGKLELSLMNYKKALNISIKENDKNNEAQALGDIGYFYQIKEDLDLSLKYLNESLVIYKNIKNKKGEANILGNIGNVYNDKGDFDLALKYQKEALAIAESLGFNGIIAKIRKYINNTKEKRV